jgi:nicotinamide mononucleotide transporter
MGIVRRRTPAPVARPPSRVLPLRPGGAQVLEWIAGLDPVEVAATVSGLASVVLTVRQSVWCWPAGLVMVALYAWVFFHAKLYADMGLQILYVFLQIYGWRTWTRGRAELPVRRVRPREAAGWGVASLAAWAGLVWLLVTHTDARSAHVDAAQTVLSLVATWLMAKKALENWLLWIVVDVLSIGMYLSRDLSLTAGLYAVFLALATLGWFSWRRSLSEWKREDDAAACSSASSCRPTSATSTSSTSRAPTSTT